MANIKGDYWQCYLDGRADQLLKNDLDVQALAEELVGNGGSLRDTVMAGCLRTAAPLESGRAKQRWVKEADEFIKSIGGDADTAYQAYLQGRIDKLAAKTERRVLDAMEEMFPDEEDAEDGKGDGEDDEDGEDDDEEE